MQTSDMTVELAERPRTPPVLELRYHGHPSHLPDPSTMHCPFCEPSADRVFLRNDEVVGLWDAFPVSPGHALLVPRRHVPTWFEATPAEQVALVGAITDAKAVIEQQHHPDGYNIGINCGAAAGQTVFHLHVHLIPRFKGDAPDPRGGVRHVIADKANYLGLPASRSDHNPTG